MTIASPMTAAQPLAHDRHLEGCRVVPAAPPLGFALFVATTGVLLLRPSELVPALAALPIYEVLILGCLLVCLPQVIEQLSWPSLRRSPVTLCMLGLLPAVVMSHLSHGFLWGARLGGIEFFKLVLYYLLLQATIDSPRRLRAMVYWLVAFVILLAGPAIAQYHGWVRIQSLSVLEESFLDPVTGQRTIVPRLRAIGIFHDPNDLCLILLVALAGCFYLVMQQRRARQLWIALSGILLYAVAMTESRGGFLALLAMIGVLVHARFGWRGAIGLALIGLPLLGLLFAGRQTTFDLEGGTGQTRIQHWSMGLSLLPGDPLFGVGQGLYREVAELEAHNSFVSSYVELGLIGGTLFFGVFYFAVRPMHDLGAHAIQIRDPLLRVLRPYILGMGVAWMVGILLLSRAYVAPTYLVAGLAAIHWRLSDVDLPRYRVNWSLLAHLAGMSALFLLAIYVFIRLFARFG